MNSTMALPVGCLLLVLGMAPSLEAQARRPGALLRAGTTLTYAGDGPVQPAWVVDSLRPDPAGLTGSECVQASIRRDPGAPPAPAERWCLTKDTLYRWSTRSARWEVSRPVGGEMHWSVTRASGDTVHYRTSTPTREVVSGIEVDVLPTTITTVDSLGRPKARLRERYALSLLTATGGTFEAPDPAAPGGWRPTRTFELREIGVPPE